MRFVLSSIFFIALLSVDFNAVDAKLRGNAKKAMRNLDESDVTGGTAETIDSVATIVSEESDDMRRKLDDSDDEADKTMETAESDPTIVSEDSEE
jgi:hypothetical protein